MTKLEAAMARQVDENVKKITLRLSDKLFEALQVISKETGFSITTLLLISIWNNVLKPKQILN